jgi:hypothetical protein
VKFDDCTHCAVFDALVEFACRVYFFWIVRQLQAAHADLRVAHAALESRLAMTDDAVARHVSEMESRAVALSAERAAHATELATERAAVVCAQDRLNAQVRESELAFQVMKD